MIDATYLKAHRTASSLPAIKRRLIGRTKGGLNTKLHAVTDAKGCLLKFFMTAGQVSDYTAPQPCWAVCPMPNGCSPTGAMMPTGSGMR